jgi:hypothetical protein
MFVLLSCARPAAPDPGGQVMDSLLEVKHISVSIRRTPEDVYRFAANPNNVPRWAAGLAERIEQIDGRWFVHGTIGRAEVRFSPDNPFGVLDHDVVLPTGETVHNPIRVIPNAGGSEVTFTLFRRPGVSREELARDAAAVEKDLTTLKHTLER